MSTCNNNLDVRLRVSADIGELLYEIDVIASSKFQSYVEFLWLEGETKVKNDVNVLVWKVLLSSEHSETTSMSHRHPPTKSASQSRSIHPHPTSVD